MRRKGILYFVMACLMSSLFLAGCSSNGSSEGEGGSKTKTVVDKEDKTLKIAMGTDIVSFDIHNHNNTSTEAVHDNMFNYLFKKDAKGEIQKELVEDYKQIDDVTVEMKLKEGVKFHNGDTLTSEDVKFTLERVATDDTLKEYPNYKQIKEVQVVDDLTFKIITHKPEPSLLHRLSRLGSGMLPKKYIDEKGWDHFLNNPVGTGPFKFKEWVRDDKIVLTVFDDYYEGKVEEWDEVIFRVIPENSTRVSELLTGGVDIAINVPPTDWERVDKNDGTHMVSETSNRNLMLTVRSTEGYPTADKKVREAIDYAIDDKALAENVLQGGAIPTRTRVGPNNFGHNPDLYNTFRYDVEKAKELLKEAGKADGFELTLHSPKGRYLQDAEVVEMIAGMLSAVGIKVNIEFMEWSNFVEMRTAKTNKDAYLIGLGNSMFDGAYSVDFYRAERFKGETDYKNDEIEKLLAESQVNMDPKSRAEQIQKIQEIAADDTAEIMLYQEKINNGVNDRIDFKPTADEMIYAPSISRK
jgi:peptide/nickel transport system substrate-binding protein